MLFKSNLIMDYCIIDTETTGLDPDTCQILEVCAIKVINQNIKDKYHSYIQTDVTIPPEITAINGIINNDVINAPQKSEVLSNLRQFIGNMVLIGHNIEFDLSFLNKHSNGLFRGVCCIDTKALSGKLLGDKLSSYSQLELEKYYGFYNIKKHSANGDTQALYEIFNRLMEDFPTYNFFGDIKHG